MTKKHFIALADYIKDTNGYCPPFTDDQIEYLANFCLSQNPRFDHYKWISYIKGECGPSGGKVRK